MIGVAKKMTTIYNYYLKNVTLVEARRIIEHIINESDDLTIENFWLIEVDKLTVSPNDRDTLEKIKLYKCTDNDRSKIRYDNIFKYMLRDLLKRNWRRLLNNEIVEKYLEYDDRLRRGVIPRIVEETIVDDMTNEVVA